MTTVLITGANRGLGYEMAKIYARQSGTKVIGCCRNRDTADALRALGDAVQVEALDMLDLNAIDALAHKLSGQTIDVLICNAGIFGKTNPADTGFEDQQFGRSEFEGDWILPYRVNVIAAMKMAEAFAPHVEASSQKKIALITSVVGSIELAMGHMFGYSASKAAANMTAKNLSIALKSKGICVNPIHPGYAKTDMSGPGADIEPEVGAQGVVDRIGEMALETTGDFLSFDGSALPW